MLLWWTLYFDSVFVLNVWDDSESWFRYYELTLIIEPIAISGPMMYRGFLIVKD